MKTPEDNTVKNFAQQILSQVNQIRSKHVNKDGEYPPILKISSGRYSIVTKAAIAKIEEVYA